jgi:selenocysteine lyase/cysteine desulfurase
MTGHDRRTILAALAGAGLAGQVHAAPSAVSSDETYWRDVRDGFDLKPGLVHLNSANLAPASRAVAAMEIAVSRDVNADPSFENRLQFDAKLETTRTALAAMLGADPGEIAITRNTSEGNRTVISGLDLRPGDEVVIWDQNHESNSLAWDVWAARNGFQVVRTATPPSPASPEELAAAFIARFTPRTRLVAFSHVSNMSGLALPAAAICRAAAERGVFSLVDGAQTFGMAHLDLHALGCDFYTGSAHKWLAGPHETGVLYVRASRIAALWPSMVTHDWELMRKAGARKFECLGQRQYARLDALHAALSARETIGHARGEQRIRQLAGRLRAGLAAVGPQISFVTPEPVDMSAGILVFTLGKRDGEHVRRTLYERFHISALAIPADGRTLVRFSPNVYNSLADIDVAVDAIGYCLAAKDIA